MLPKGILRFLRDQPIYLIEQICFWNYVAKHLEKWLPCENSSDYTLSALDSTNHEKSPFLK